MSFGKTVQVAGSSKPLPLVGLGTWQSAPGEVKNAVIEAVKAGYRHLDLAKVYQNQTEVGEALKELVPSVVKREDLWITSKLWNNAHKPHLVERALDDTLAELGTDYLDLYLIHWPVSLDSGDDIKDLFPRENGKAKLDLQTTLVDTWKAVIALQKTGKVKSIGVSNFSIEAVDAITKATGVKPAVNQLEAHPLLPQEEITKHHDANRIHITAYSPLGGSYGKLKILTEYPEVQEVAKKLNADPAQVLLAWGTKHGWSVVPKSVTPKRIVSNFQEIELSDEDYKIVSSLINSLGRHRMNNPQTYNPAWPIDVFGEPEEQGIATKINVGA